MLTEDGVVMHSHDVILIVLVLLLEVAKQAQLDTSLMLEALLVTDYFDGNHHLVLMVKALEGLAKTTRAKLV